MKKLSIQVKRKVISSQIIQGHVLDVLAGMKAESVHCVVTSPPYWGLRDYQIESQVWGGKVDCKHKWQEHYQPPKGGRNLPDNMPGTGGNRTQQLVANPRFGVKTQFCSLCNAWRGSLGLEPTPELYLSHMREVMAGVWRVLRKDGVVFLNIGDSYAGVGGYSKKPVDKDHPYWSDAIFFERPLKRGVGGTIKPQDLCLIPERLVIALQADGWYVRSVIVWAKGREGDIEECGPGSVMPESVQGV